ncbi:ERMES complex subunit mmm1 [Ophidiomyces ophidiicola]|nr:ERMES complex subunit mmm1 [Ophidiomyces ophidiicola]
MADARNETALHTPSSLSFTQGLLVGQLSVVLLIGAFIKFFIFGEAPPSSFRGQARRASPYKRSYSMSGGRDFNPRTLKEKPSSNILRPIPSSSTNTRSILRKTYYSATPTNFTSKHGRHRPHHSTHQPESLDWFNVLIAQTIAQYRETAYILKDSPTSSILDSLTTVLNNPDKKPSFIDKITVTDISLGEEFPIFSNCRVISIDDPNTDGGRLQALMDVDLSDDNLSLAIETSFVLNYPKPYSAILPVALSVSVVRFSGTLCISFVPGTTETPADTSAPSASRRPDSQPHSLSRENINSPFRQGLLNTIEQGQSASPGTTGIPKTSLAFSFLPDYRLELSVSSLIGSRSRLQDVPKVAQLVEARVQAWFEERVVEPRVQVVALPNIWPRMGRTGVRGQEEQQEVSSGDSSEIPVTNLSMLGTRDTVSESRQGTRDASDGLRYRRNVLPNNGETPNEMYRQDQTGQEQLQIEDPFQIPGSLPDAVPVT